MRLSGIGESFALRIIQYREENGPFATVDDLQNVRGIGSKKLARLRPYITVK
jgi:competence protein ComEA